ncbi:caspase family protein [Priestia megaterium]|uniref:caspase family protein n=1 Tax=Priestia megaterium TaxID=1404 RepID=UPI000BFC02A9|nr:caspase family protein [Priestia megaterium]PGR79750.1 peptidase C14 [Priestia megaterium]
MMYKALIIAVDQYINASHLPNTVNDATEIERLLLESPSLFKKQDVQVIRGSILRKGTLQAILNSFFQNASPTDVLFLFWAGHGAFLNGEGYFVPYEGDTQFTEETMIKMSEVRDLIDQTAASTVLSFFDTCHSGAVARSMHQEMIRGLEVKGSGKVLIAACTESQGAWDRSGHGAFTDYLIRGLEGEAADSNGDIDVYNLYSYVSKKLYDEFGNQEPVIKSTLNGKPLLLKRLVTRENQAYSPITSNKREIVKTSGVNFWLGAMLAEYDEYQQLRTGEYLLTLINPNDQIEQQIKSMNKNKKYPFAIRSQADIVILEDFDIVSSREKSVIKIKLKSSGEKGNPIFSQFSVSGGMGKTLSADEIARLRARRILLGEQTIPSGYGDSLVESMIANPSDSRIKVTPNLIAALAGEGYSVEKIRVMAIGSLVLTGTLETIETLSFVVENKVVTKIHLIGHRPKFYENVEAVKIEIEEPVNIAII